MEHEQLNSSKSILPLGSISEILNMMFKPGDRLQLYAGAEPYKESGSFLATTDDVLVWVDSNNNVSFQYIGGILGIRKIGSSESDSSESENEAEENQGSSQNMSVKRESKTEDKASSEEMPPHVDKAVEPSANEASVPPTEVKEPQLVETEKQNDGTDSESEESSSVTYFTLESSEESSEEIIEEAKKRLLEIEDKLTKEKENN